MSKISRSNFSSSFIKRTIILLYLKTIKRKVITTFWIWFQRRADVSLKSLDFSRKLLQAQISIQSQQWKRVEQGLQTLLHCYYFEQALTYRTWSLNLAQKICQAYMKYLKTFFECFRLFMLNIINIMKLVQNHQWKHQNNMWNLFKINNKDVSELLLVSLLLTWNIHCSCVSIVKFKQVNTGWDGSCPSFLL